MNYKFVSSVKCIIHLFIMQNLSVQLNSTTKTCTVVEVKGESGNWGRNKEERSSEGLRSQNVVKSTLQIYKSNKRSCETTCPRRHGSLVKGYVLPTGHWGWWGGKIRLFTYTSPWFQVSPKFQENAIGYKRIRFLNHWLILFSIMLLLPLQ